MLDQLKQFFSVDAAQGSQDQVSIKFPIEQLGLSNNGQKATWPQVELVAEDVKAAGNVIALQWEKAIDAPTIVTEDEQFALDITFAEQAEVA